MLELRVKQAQNGFGRHLAFVGIGAIWLVRNGTEFDLRGRV